MTTWLPPKEKVQLERVEQSEPLQEDERVDVPEIDPALRDAVPEPSFEQDAPNNEQPWSRPEADTHAAPLPIVQEGVVAVPVTPARRPRANRRVGLEEQVCTLQETLTQQQELIASLQRQLTESQHPPSFRQQSLPEIFPYPQSRVG